MTRQTSRRLAGRSIGNMFYTQGVLFPLLFLEEQMFTMFLIY